MASHYVKYGRRRMFTDPHGYDQKRIFFRTNSFVLAHSSSSSSIWPSYLTSCAELMSSRAFCHHLRHLDAAGALSHHWCSGIGNHFWLCQSSRSFFFHTSFSLYEGIQQVLSLLVFLHQVLEGDQAMTIFFFLLYYSISLHLSYNSVFFTIFGHLTPMTWQSGFPWKEANLSAIVFVVVHNSLLYRKIFWT